MLRTSLSLVTAAVLAAAVASAATYSMLGSQLQQQKAQQHELLLAVSKLRQEVTSLQRRQFDGATAVQAQFVDVPSATHDAADLRALVRDVLRDERQRSVLQVQRQTMQDWKAWRTGPYGRFNSRVNGMASRLDLNAAQAQIYHELLQDFDDRAAVLYDDLEQDLDLRLGNAPDWQAFERRLAALEDARAELDAEFDRAFIATLAPEQAQSFERLPADARGMGPDAGLGALQISVADLGEG